MSDVINVGSLVADLDLDTSRLDRGVKNAESALESIKGKIAGVQAQFNAGAIGVKQYADQMLYLREVENDLIGAINAGTNAVGAHAAALAKSGASWNNYVGGARNAQSATSAMGQGWAMAGMQFGYMVDDIQYGVSSIINNVAPLAHSVSLGLGATSTMAAGIATGAQIAAVATYQLVVHWSDLMDLMGQGIPVPAIESLKKLQAELKATQKAIEDQEKKPRFTSLAEKDAYENNKKKAEALETEVKNRKEVEDLTNAQSKAERERGAGFKEAVAETGGQAAIDELEAALKAKADAEGVSLDPARIKELAKRKGMTLTDKQANALSGQKFLANPETGELETPEKLSKDMLARAGKGEKDSRNSIMDLIDPTGSLASPFAKAIDTASPERKAEKEAKEKFEKENDKQAKGEKQRQEEEDRFEQQRFDDELNERRDAIRRREARKKQGVRQIKEDSGGIDAFAQNLAAGAMTGQISPQDAMNQIKGILKSNDSTFIKENKAAKATAGLGDDARAADRAEERATIAAKEIMKDAGGDLKRRAIDEALNPSDSRDAEQRKVSKSEQFDAADLAAKVQSGVNDEDKQERKKQTSFLDQAVKHLAVIAKNGGANPWAGFEEK